ncbi:uncharacterized protein DC041_0004874, partial [Schistosoma bovis]
LVLQLTLIIVIGNIYSILALPSTSTVTSHQQLPCDGSITSDYTNQMSAPFDVYHSHELAKRLPAHISDPNGDLCKTPARQSNTLPVKCIHYSKTTGNFDTLFNSTQFPTSGQYLCSFNMKLIQSSRSSLAASISHKHKTTEPIMSTRILTLSKSMSTSHPTAPHSYLHLFHSDPVCDVYHVSKAVTTPNTDVLNFVFTDLE